MPHTMSNLIKRVPAKVCTQKLLNSIFASPFLVIGNVFNFSICVKRYEKLPLPPHFEPTCSLFEFLLRLASDDRINVSLPHAGLDYPAWIIIMTKKQAKHYCETKQARTNDDLVKSTWAHVSSLILISSVLRLREIIT
jgi:hypothetical protein